MTLSVRTRLCLLLAASHLFVALLAGIATYYQTRRAVYEQVRNYAKVIATIGAAQIDGDLHESIKTRDDETSAAYLAIRDTLRTIRRASSQGGRAARYVYTLRKSPNHPEVIEFCVDADDNFADMTHVGDIYKGNTAEPIRLEELQVDYEFTVDQWGRWLNATAPIRNSRGEVVAGLGVDIAADSVTSDLAKTSVVGTSMAVIAGLFGIGLGSLIALQYTRPLLQLQNTVAALQSGSLQTRSKIETQDEFGNVARAVNAMASGLQEREMIKSAFARYVSHDVLQSILDSRELPTLNGQRRHITVLFCDIRGFTALAENMRAEDVLDMLNEFFSRMIDIIHRHKGTLDKLIGDGFMAVFGAPLDDPHQEEHALQAALDMLHSLTELCGEWQLAGKQQLKIGIGINSGHAIVGNVGSPMRMEYTAIGDTVNLASRLEEATKDFGHAICFSEYTYAAIKGIFSTCRLGSLNVRGRIDPVNVYAFAGDESAIASSSCGAVQQRNDLGREQADETVLS